MSAAAAWGVPTHAATPSSTRPRLVLVQGGEVSAERGGRRAARLRITRRGRLVLSTALAVVLVVLGALLATRVAVAGDSGAHLVTVPAGTTLSEIAAQELPDRPVAQAVVDIQRASGLAGTEISAGQVLTVPVP